MKCPECGRELTAGGSECYPEDGFIAECSSLECLYERELNIEEFKALRKHNFTTRSGNE